MNKKLKKTLLLGAGLLFVLLIGYLVSPWVLAVVIGAYLVFGIIDVSRNQLGGEAPVIKNYFAGNGLLTWVLSPFNLLMDLMSRRTGGILKPADLPPECQREIEEVIAVAKRENSQITQRVEAALSRSARVMLLYKWYGRQVDSSIPEYAKNLRYVKTIGISVFSPKTTTKFHYGPLRITYRVLYNLTPTETDDVFIDVGRTRHLWRDDPLFIFDDTLMHRSANNSDKVRYCLFVDIMRPSAFLGLNAAILNVGGVILKGINRVFYKNWAFVN